MSSVYTPSAAALISITIPSDGDSPIQASDVNPAFEALADASHNTKRLIESFAPNFLAGVSAPLVHHVRWMPAQRQWGACGNNNDQFVRTADPFVWPSSSELGGAVHGLPVWDFDMNDAGEIVAVATGLDRYWTATWGGTWTARSSILGVDFDEPSIVWDTTANLWCVVGPEQGSGACTVATSPNGTTWTNRTAPTGMPTNVPFTLGYGAGVIVMRAVSGTNLYTSRSTNGGVTWSAAVVTALGFTGLTGGARHSSPVWTGTEWIIIVVNTTSNDSAIFRSSTGASWTLRAHLTAASISFFAHANGVLVGSMPGLFSKNPIVWSSDGGASWKYGPRAIEATSITIASGWCIASSPMQFVLSMAGMVYPGLAFGDGLGSLT